MRTRGAALGIIEKWDGAELAFRDRLDLVRADQWDLPTPCAEWTVRDLVNHKVDGCKVYTHMLRGDAHELRHGNDVDWVGDDPAAAYVAAAADLREAFTEPGAFERNVVHPSGELRFTGAQLLAVWVFDTVVHTWDLARAIAADETLPDSVLRVAWAVAQTLETLPESWDHQFAEPGVLNDDVGLQPRVLAAAGRVP